ncbi:MAG: hypothetical protein UZ11_BCD004000680 [Bacteroidetes bacterium OLB11]|nr:MAG: hypothetical protein UZ11_BCD004000680 [Bacteroidetes bacterium OLB11]
MRKKNNRALNKTYKVMSSVKVLSAEATNNIILLASQI